MENYLLVPAVEVASNQEECQENIANWNIQEKNSLTLLLYS